MVIIIDNALFTYLKRSKFDRISQIKLLVSYNTTYFKMYLKK